MGDGGTLDEPSKFPSRDGIIDLGLQSKTSFTEIMLNFTEQPEWKKGISSK